jgi:hypothetical protein
MARKIGWVGLLVIAACVASACSKGPAMGTVNGDVTLDGQPLQKGYVQFSPVDGQGQTAGAMIEGGKFSGQVSIGKMKVELHATKVVGKRKAYDTPESPWEDEVAEILPPRYNFQSNLTLDVKSGTQDVKYDLKTGK